MNDQKWYAIDKHGVAIPCADQEEARNTAAEVSALYPSCAPYRVAQLVALPETHVVAPREPSIAMVDAGIALAGALEHILEDWNQDENETAMADALCHIIETADEALTRWKEEGK